MATFDELVQQINDNLDNQRDRGTAFEKMVVAYLKNEPTYKQKFSNVWMLNEVPAKYHISKRDTGVDFVAKDYAGNLTAVQAKYYKGKVGKDTINSFVAEAGKDYYSAGMLVSSTDDWNRNAEAALHELDYHNCVMRMLIGRNFLLLKKIIFQVKLPRNFVPINKKQLIILLPILRIMIVES